MLTPHSGNRIPQFSILLKVLVGDLEQGADLRKDEMEQFIEDLRVDASCRLELSHIQII
jgi:hypothetical protein